MTNSLRKRTSAISVAVAKARFSECVRTAETGETVVITRRGKPVAALVPARKRPGSKRLLATGPQAGLAGLAGRQKWSEEFVALLTRSRRSPPRPLPKLDE